MTINQYLARYNMGYYLTDERGKESKQYAFEHDRIWSNDACLGYIAAALEEEGETIWTIEDLIWKVKQMQSKITVEEAEAAHEHFLNMLEDIRNSENQNPN